MGSGYRIKVARALLVGVVALAGLTAVPPTPAYAAPRPIPDPVPVTITPGGFSPASVTAVVGQSIEFVNESGAEQSVKAADGAFDSGPIPPGGGYGLSLGAAGTWDFASANNANFAGTLSVGFLDLPGNATQTVASALPVIPIPPVFDMDRHPDGFFASTSRLVVMFKDSATVQSANDALAQANVKVIGTVTGLNMVIAQLPEVPPAGDFAPVSLATETLRAHAAVEAVTLDKTTEAAVAVMPADSAAPTTWAWDDERGTTGNPPLGSGDNWGLESARFPSAWNVVDNVRLRNPQVQTVIYDHGFEPTHPDLDLPVVDLCRVLGTLCTANPADTGSEREHGTHVAGTVGATFDNPGATPGSTLGVSGANPFARMFAVSWGGKFVHARTPSDDPSFQRASATSANYAFWNALIEEKKPGGKFPNLRVVNMSATTNVLVTAANGVAVWGANNSTRRCGPGYNDDTGGTGPCTPNTLDSALKDTAEDGEMARKFAEHASAKDVLLSVASSNYSTDVCQDSTQTASPNATPFACPSGFTFTRVDTRRFHAFGWADANWSGTGADPILMVEAVDINRKRAGFSNIGGEVSAPGVNITSTFPPTHSCGTSAPPNPAPIPCAKPGYHQLGGTSMASPHVAGLAGLLTAYKPSLTVGQVRAAIIGGARNDTTDGAAPRIDAYNSLLLVGAMKDLADWSDPSQDGNRRITRARGGAETPDLLRGPDAGALKTTSAPDGKVDIRDFRRFRDALLAVCSDRTGIPGCPAIGTVVLDGRADHPKNDLNNDGCVFGASPCRTEEAWSRFDLNGDGVLERDRKSPIITPGGSAGTQSDMDLFQSVFEAQPGSWSASELPALLKSGDLEIHADAMFKAGATKVDVEVRYGAGRAIAFAEPLERRGSSIVVTVPTIDAGQPVEIIGRAQVGETTLESGLELETLKHGQDARIDLCVPTLQVTSADSDLRADKVDVTKMYATILKCDDAPAEAEHVNWRVARADDTPAEATLSAPTSTTDKSGRAAVDLKAGDGAEKVKVLAEITIEGHPGTVSQIIRGQKTVNIEEPPRLLYRLEETVTSWELTTRGLSSDGLGGEIDGTTVYTSSAPVVNERTGAVTPIRGNATVRADARVTETVGPNAVEYNYVATNDRGFNESGHRRVLIPTTQRKQENVRVGGAVLNFWKPNGSPEEFMTFADTYFDESEDKITVHKLSDLAALHYRYSATEEDLCPPSSFTCGSMFSFDAIALDEREDGSNFQWTADISNVLNFTRDDDTGQWGTYRYCGPEKTYQFRPEDIIKPLYWQFGTAHRKVRFIATITNDPNAKAEDLALPTNCTDPKPPIAAIGRDWVTAKEGQVVKFLDASSDPNGDVVQWAWEFGDGTTSTESTPDHSYDDDGTYHVKLTVTDESGNTDSHEINVTITNVAPTVEADDVKVGAGTAPIVQVLLFDPGERDQEALTFEASFGGKPGLPIYPTRTTPGGAQNIGLGPLPDGQHELTLKVTDKDGASTTKTINVDVGEEPSGTVEPDEELESEPAPGCDFGVKLDIGEQDFVELVSQYRVENGRTRVYPSPALTEAALEHARWLRDNDLFQHEGKDGSTPIDRAQEAGYPTTASVGENLTRGPRSAAGALVAWKVSNPHNINQLNTAWRAIGIARIGTPRGTLWVAVYGDTMDCPSEPPDLEEPNSDPLDPEFPGGEPPVQTKAWTKQTANPPVPHSAITVSDVTPQTGQTVTVQNRTPSTTIITTGDGRPGFQLQANVTTTIGYLDPGAFSIAADVGGRKATLGVVVGGIGRPPQVQYLGDTSAPQGSSATLVAKVTTANGDPVAGRQVTFELGTINASATTNGSGIATKVIRANVTAGGYSLVVQVPALPGGAGAVTSAPFTVTANQPPIVNANGPYDVLVNANFAPDFQGSFDPDGGPITIVGYDFNNDDELDHNSVVTITASVLNEKLCGGTCAPGTDYTLTAVLQDNKGAFGEDDFVVRFRRDFSIAMTPDHAVLNPGGNISFLVNAVTDSGFNQPVALSVPNLPTGVTATFTNPSPVPTGFNTSLLNLSAAPNAPSFDGPIVVRGTSGNLVHDANSIVEVEFGLVPQCFGAADITVRDRETNLPMAGLTFGNKVTDANGKVRLDNYQLGAGNAPGFALAAVTPPDYWSDSKTFTVACGVVVSVELRPLKKRFGELGLRAVVGVPDPNDHTAARAITPTDTPVPDASISYFVPAGTNNATSGPDGRVKFTGIPMGNGTNLPVSGTATSTKTGYWIANGPGLITVSADAPTPEVVIPMVAHCSGTADVRVLDETTRLPIPNADVSVFAEGGGDFGKTGPDGRIHLENVTLGQNNSAINRFPQATAVINGRTISRSGSFRLEDCGSHGIADILLKVPVERRSSLEGRVTDVDTGEPLVDFIVLGPSPTGATRTDADGRYKFENFFIGFDNQTTSQVRLDVQAPHLHPVEYFPQGDFVFVEADKTSVKDFQLLRKKYGDVKVTVRDAVTDDLLVGASIHGLSIPGVSEHFSGPDGTKLFPHQPLDPGNAPRKTSVSAGLPGYWFAGAEVTITADTLSEVTVRPVRECKPARVTGRVFNAATGLPLQEATVVYPGAVFPYPTTDVNGRFLTDEIRIANNKPFALPFTAFKEGFLSATRTVTLYCGATITLDYGRADTGSASLSGTVTRAADGAPVAGAIVGTEWGATTVTATDGTYSFATVPMGGEAIAKTWKVDVEAPVGSKLTNQSKNVTVHPDEAAKLNFALTAPTNQRPIANDQTVQIPTNSSFIDVTLTGSDPEGSPLTFIRLGTGENIARQTLPNANTQFFMPTTVDEQDFFFLVNDGDRDSEIATVTVTRAPNQLPTAVISGVTVADEGSTVELNSFFSSDPDGFISAANWDLDNDAAYDDGPFFTANVSLPDDGTVPVGLQITDNRGAFGFDTHSVQFKNVAPAVVAGGPYTVATGVPFAPEIGFVDPGADTWTATVDYGDGSGKHPLPLGRSALSLHALVDAFSYGQPGPYTLTVEVCDDDGGCGTDTADVIVEGPPPPPANADLEVTKTHEGDFTRGGAYEYEITVKNNGPDPVGAFTIIDDLPDGLVWEDEGGFGWSCGSTAGVTTCNNLGGLASGESKTLTAFVEVNADAPNSVTNVASASHTGTDPVETNNEAEDPTDIVGVPPTTTTSTSTTTTTTTAPTTTTSTSTSTTTSTSTSTTTTTFLPTTTSSTTTTSGPTTTATSSTTSTTAGPTSSSSSTTTTAPGLTTSTTVGTKGTTVPATTVPPTTPTTAAPSVVQQVVNTVTAPLPFTGTESGALAGIAFMLLGSGLVLMVVRRRRT